MEKKTKNRRKKKGIEPRKEEAGRNQKVMKVEGWGKNARKKEKENKSWNEMENWVFGYLLKGKKKRNRRRNQVKLKETELQRRKKKKRKEKRKRGWF